MISTKKILSFLFIAFVLVVPTHFVHADAPSGSVAPGGTCSNSTECSGMLLCLPNFAADSSGKTLICQNASDLTKPVSGGGSTPGTPVNGGGSTPGTPVNGGGSTPGTPVSGGGSTPNSGTLQNPLNAQSIQQLLQEVLAYVQIIGGIFLTLMLVVTGFMFVIARGNPEKVSQARSALLWTAIGGLLLLGAQALSLVISSTVQAL